MAKKATNDSEKEILEKILFVLQDLLILQAANVGVDKEGARKIAGVASARVSRVWQQLKKA